MNSKTSRNSTRKPDRQVDRVRKAIVGSVLVAAALVLAAGIWYTTGSSSGEFTAGEHYRVVEGAPERRAGEPIVVREFFSYGCVHCRNFDPMIEDWKAGLAEDVRFERVPAAFSPAWIVLAQSYYALEELGALERNHDRLFRAIHDTGRQFMTLVSVADFVDGNGTTRAEFLSTANGSKVARRIRDADLNQRALMIDGVPALVIADRYVVGMRHGRKAALDIADHLIALERAGGAGPASATEANAN
jgi:thiol:disulfide interchange protein DsbA